jgi:hypothetical protein
MLPLAGCVVLLIGCPSALLRYRRPKNHRFLVQPPKYCSSPFSLLSSTQPCRRHKSVVEPITHENLNLLPATNGRDKGLSYLLLGEALATGKLRVTERGKGTAPDLTLENETDQMVFLMDAEALVGAKQNRILNTSILAAANSSMTIPVSCVEQGRWQYAGAAMRKRPIS